VCTIRPSGTQLPAIGDDLPGNEVTIDGYTQPGAKKNTLANGTNARLKIQVNGAAAPASADGITIGGLGNTVRGLVINGWAFEGVVFGGSDANGNTVESNFIGTNASGYPSRG
jgi:hypothetical protein